MHGGGLGEAVEIGPFPRRLKALQILAARLPTTGRDNRINQKAAQYLFLGPTQRLCRLPVPADDLEINVRRDDRVKGLINDQAGAFLLGAKRLLRFLESRDVLGDAERPDDFTLAVIEWHFARQRPGDMAVRPGFLLGYPDDRLAGADDFLFVLEGLPGMFLSEKVKVGFANQFLRPAQVEERRHGRAATKKARLPILEIDGVRRGIQQRP